ncbi:FHA domain-containing protein [Methanobacterium oryzae]|uniref:FHA domain-containing protein n=1 Tax=Methanobacterium oryzae TaxID=69540 RepID=UPI003D25D260
MSRIKIILIFAILAIVTIVSILIFSDLFVSWFKFQWLDLLYAAIMAIIAGIIIEYFYRKYLHKSKFLRTTIVNKPRKLLAKLVLPDNKEFIINEYERTFGREDFVGTIIVDDLLFLGKQHFKLTLMDDGFYIEDLNTKNGTIVNGEEIKGMGKIKLRNQDEILVAKVLKLKYLEQESYD